jgi:hypothetical protein
MDLYIKLADLMAGNSLDVVLIVLTKALAAGAAANGVSPNTLLDMVQHSMADVYKDYQITEGGVQ